MDRFQLCEKCPNTEFFLVCIFPYSVRIRENTDQKKLRTWTIFTQCPCSNDGVKWSMHLHLSLQCCFGRALTAEKHFRKFSKATKVDGMQETNLRNAYQNNLSKKWLEQVFFLSNPGQKQSFKGALLNSCSVKFFSINRKAPWWDPLFVKDI